MDREHAQLMIDYTYWARDRLLRAVGRLSESEYLARRPLDYGSIHATLVHTYAAEVLWHSRWQGTSPTRMLDTRDVVSLAELEERWREQERGIREYLSTVPDEALATAVVAYQSTQGQRFERKLWQTVAHLINHGTHHRSEVASSITQLNHSPGDLDLIAYLNLGR